MKKYSVTILSAISLGIAMPASAVVIAPAAAPTPATVNNAGCAVVSVNSTFTFVPSANVGVAYNCDAGGTIVAVNSGNIKGKYTYGGSSNGGSVKQCGSSGTGLVSTANGYTIPAPAVLVTSDGCS